VIIDTHLIETPLKKLTFLLFQRSLLNWG